ncbi:hypothetical protein J7M28_03215, partial [bacterium]|nr:hypothetical protein [bacterium]
DAYQKAKELASAARERGLSVLELARMDESLNDAMQTLCPENLEILADPARYIGDAPTRVEATRAHWESKMLDLLQYFKHERRVLKKPPTRQFRKLAKIIADAEAGKNVPEQSIAQSRREMIEGS